MKKRITAHRATIDAFFDGPAAASGIAGLAADLPGATDEIAELAIDHRQAPGAWLLAIALQRRNESPELVARPDPERSPRSGVH
jgi:hypothetical protein